MIDAEPTKKPTREYRKHGLTKLLRGRHGPNAMKFDGRTRHGKALAKHRSDLLASLGGEAGLSAQELALVKLCAREMVYVDEIDIELFANGILNKRKRQVHPLLTQRMPIADSVERRLKDLGLERRMKQITVSNYIQSKKPPTKHETTYVATDQNADAPRTIDTTSNKEG